MITARLSAGLWVAAAVMLAAGAPSGFVLCILLAGWAPHVAITAWSAVAARIEKSNLQSPVDKDEEAFERASFLAKVSHELRTPLHNILGLLQILQKSDHNPTHQHYLHLVREASTTLLGTINDVLDYSQSNTGKLNLKLEPTDLQAPVREALRMVAPRAFEKDGLELLCKWAADIPRYGNIDAARVRQILINLLGNAIKFTHTGFVQLCVSAEQIQADEYRLLFEVRDTGIGIPADKLDSIFEAFNQVDVTVVRRTQGTGLGLTIVKQLLSAFKGDIRVTSEVGRGSVFTFWLPVKVNVPDLVAAEKMIDQMRLGIVSRSPALIQLLTDELQAARKEISLCSIPSFDSYLPELNSQSLIVSGETIENEMHWKFLADFIADNDPKSVVLLLAPAHIEIRERSRQMGITQVLTLPILSRDIITVLSGDTPEKSAGESEEYAIPHAEVSLHILVADDIPTNQLILRSMLVDAGHKVTTVNDGQELFSALKRQIEGTRPPGKLGLFDLVLTDIQMPRLDGITVIARTRALERTVGAEPLPIVGVTAHAFATEQEKIFNAGATGVITKPIDLKELHATLERVKKRTQTAAAEKYSGLSTLNFMQSSGGSADSFILSSDDILATRFSSIDDMPISVRDVIRRYDGNTGRTLLVMKSFLEGCKGLTGQLMNERETGSPKKVIRIAHSLKGMLVEVGAHRAAELASRMESLARSGDIEGARCLIEPLRAGTDLAAEAIELIVQRFGAGKLSDRHGITEKNTPE